MSIPLPAQSPSSPDVDSLITAAEENYKQAIPLCEARIESLKTELRAERARLKTLNKKLGRQPKKKEAQ